MSNSIDSSKVYFKDKSNKLREQMRILRKKIIIVILDKRIYERNIKRYQDCLSQRLDSNL